VLDCDLPGIITAFVSEAEIKKALCNGFGELLEGRERDSDLKSS